MKKILFAFAATACSLLLASCRVENFITLESPSSITAEAEGTSTTVSLKSSSDWKARSDCDWVVLHNGEGKAGICDFSLSVLPNTTKEQRTATVTITAEGCTKSISITQKASTGKSPIVIPDGYVPTIKIEHGASSFTAPVIEYTSSLPMVDWGDGSGESYCQELKHQYDNTAQRSVTIYSDDISAFTITDLTDIISVEAYNFKEN